HTPTTEIYTLSLHDALPICSGIGRPCAALVTGTSSSVWTDSMSSSRYWTPTKYWLWLTGSIQKFFLWNWMLEFKAATTFFITSRSEEHTSELQSRGHLVCRL